MKKLKDFILKDKKVLVRCDFNVPLDEQGKIADDFKIVASLPTIQYLVENQAKVILMSHFDPRGMKFFSPEFTLKPVADILSKQLGIEVAMAEDCVGEKTATVVNALQPGEVLLLENVRFHGGEVDNTEEFAKKLSELGDIFINDAFAECHRNYASIVGIPKFLPHGAGLLLEKEIEHLEKIIKDPERPLVAVVGGAKVQTKAPFIKNISEIADVVLISGLIKKELLVEEHSDILQNTRIMAPEGTLDAKDIDEETLVKFQEKIKTAKTIVWNGPFGNIEDGNFRKGTLAIAKAIIKSGAFSVVGGGSTVDFINDEGLRSKFSWVSTGGGAMLDFLSGEELPGIKALE